MAGILSLQKLSVSYAVHEHLFQACRDVELDIEQEDFFCIMGQSGSGKTSLVLSLTKLLPENAVYSGKVIFENYDLLSLDSKQLHALRGSAISYIFQEPYAYLDPLATIGRQIDEIFKVHKQDSSSAARSKTLKILEDLKFPDAYRIYQSYPHQLSGGMNQRISIAMALALNPKILVCDEPTSSLDFVTSVEIMNFIKEIKNRFKTTVIFVTHDLYMSSQYANNMAVMLKGLILEISPKDLLFSNPQHPYTRYIVNIFNEFQDGRIIPLPVKEELGEISSGCPFINQCPEKGNICSSQIPPLKKIGDNRYLRCHR